MALRRGLKARSHPHQCSCVARGKTGRWSHPSPHPADGNAPAWRCSLWHPQPVLPGCAGEDLPHHRIRFRSGYPNDRNAACPRWGGKGANSRTHINTSNLSVVGFMPALAASAAVTLPRAKVGFRQGGAVRPKHDLFQNDGWADRIKAQCVDPRMAQDDGLGQLYIGKASAYHCSLPKNGRFSSCTVFTTCTAPPLTE